MLSLLFLLAATAFGRGVFHTQQETIDRVVDGVSQRSYIVVFNEQGPFLGENFQKLLSWLEVTHPEVKPENVQHVYEIGAAFRGYALWATPEVVEKILAHEATKYVEEDSVVRALAPFTSRPDWGQVRSNQPGAYNLATYPQNLYNTQYPSGSNDTDWQSSPGTQWDFQESVYDSWNGSTHGRINRGARAKIWVVDTGVLINHQEFAPNRVFPYVDCVVTTGGCLVNVGSAIDCNGHGTHCAGSAGGNYRGIASDASLASVRVLGCGGSGTNANVILGFQYVANNQEGAYLGNLMSVSLGGGASVASDDAVRAAVGRGVIAVVAAGNNNADACNYSPARASTGTGGCITVMASDRLDARASFTNTGSCGTVFAPGVSVHSAYYNSPTTYSTLSGTSMATPLTAGAIALYVTTQSSPVHGTDGIKGRIVDSATNNRVTGTLLAGTPNRIINARWQ